MIDVTATAQRLDDPDPDTRAHARMQLVACGEDAVPALVAGLQAAGSVGRREAAVALSELGPRSAIPALLEALAREPYEIASWAARALGKTRDPSAMPALVDKLGDEEMRNSAALALGELGDSSAIAALRRALVALADRLDYGSYLGRYWLASALGRLGDRSAETRAALCEVIDRDFGPENQQTWGSLRDEAVDLLIAIDPNGARAFLSPFLKRDRETLQVRYRIARHYWLGGERAPELLALIERMSRHPLYPRFAAEARDLVAPEN